LIDWNFQKRAWNVSEMSDYFFWMYLVGALKRKLDKIMDNITTVLYMYNIKTM